MDLSGTRNVVLFFFFPFYNSFDILLLFIKSTFRRFSMEKDTECCD